MGVVANFVYYSLLIYIPLYILAVILLSAETAYKHIGHMWLASFVIATYFTYRAHKKSKQDAEDIATFRAMQRLRM